MALEQKKDETAADGTQYSIIIKNSSGNTAIIGLFQQQPQQFQKGYPLVWQSAGVQDGGQVTLTWSLDWGLSYGTSNGHLNNGVQFNVSGPVIDANPGSNTNGALVAYDENSSTFIIKSQAINNLPEGCIGLVTDGSFTTQIAQKLNMDVCVCVQGVPVAAISGQPNLSYTFSTHPTYYLAIINYKAGVAVDITSLSNPTQATFADGDTELNYTLNDENEFIPN